MSALGFYLVYPFVYLIASLPFWALYSVSDVFYYLFRLSGYRRKVVVQNLRNSFPDKSEKEIQQLCREYFRYLCDLTLETFKTLTMTEQEARDRCTLIFPDWLKEFANQKQSMLLVLGHYGNWEWGGPGFTLHSGIPLNVIYRPLSNPYFEKMMTGMRTKFGTRITPAKNTLREMVSLRNQHMAFAFIADQAATIENGHWMEFLHQDTSVYTGPEKLAVKFNYPVVFMNIKRLRRGFYEVAPELLFAHPKETQPDQITETFTRRLEQEIRKDPVIWLWSHRRWKHKRPA